MWLALQTRAVMVHRRLHARLQRRGRAVQVGQVAAPAEERLRRHVHRAVVAAAVDMVAVAAARQILITVVAAVVAAVALTLTQRDSSLGQTSTQQARVRLRAIVAMPLGQI